MNTSEINSILSNDPQTARFFLGTFACDQLPSETPHTFSLIVNTDKSDQPGLHWQSIFGVGDSVFFFDSYGRRPRGLILRFCKRFDHIYYNAVSHQRPDTASCGPFSIHHVHMQSRGVPFEKIVEKFVRILHDDRYINRWMKKTYQFQ